MRCLDQVVLRRVFDWSVFVNTLTSDSGSRALLRRSSHLSRVFVVVLLAHEEGLLALRVHAVGVLWHLARLEQHARVDFTVDIYIYQVLLR